jgi:hypothetical protein
MATGHCKGWQRLAGNDLTAVCAVILTAVCDVIFV